MNTKCQKVYLRHYRPKNKKPGDICGNPTLETWGQLCPLHCATAYQYQINKKRQQRLAASRAIQSVRLLEKSLPTPPESGIEIKIQKMI